MFLAAGAATDERERLGLVGLRSQIHGADVSGDGDARPFLEGAGGVAAAVGGPAGRAEQPAQCVPRLPRDVLDDADPLMERHAKDVEGGVVGHHPHHDKQSGGQQPRAPTPAEVPRPRGEGTPLA